VERVRSARSFRESEEHTISPRRRKKIAAIVLLVLAAGVWAYILAKGDKSFKWPVFVATVTALDWKWLALSVVFSYSTYVVRALRWAVMLKPLRPHPHFWPLLSATIVGYSAVTALGRAAEMVRPYLIANREDVPFSSQVAAWVVERIYDILIALAVFGFALSQVSGSGVYLGVALSWALRAGGLVIGLGASVCLAILLAMKYRSEHIQRWVLRAVSFLSRHHFERVERLITGFLDGVSSTKSQSALARMIAYTLVEWLLIAACYACVLRAFGTAMPLAPISVLIIMGFVSFGSLVQLPAVGGGAQVTAVLVLTEVFGVPIEMAAGAGLMLWAISFAAIVPVGALLAVGHLPELQKGLARSRMRAASPGV
jgi:glycosyltransferase 2 family protein